MIAGLLPHGLVAPWARRPPGILGIDDPLTAPVGIDQLELVLEARDVRRGRSQLPRPAVPGQLVRQPLAQLVGEADSGETTAGIGDVEAELDHGSVSSVWKFARRTVRCGFQDV